MGTKTLAKRARFDGSQQRRRSMLAKVHIGKKDLRLSDDDYRAIMLEETGHDSAADCSEEELDRVLKRFEARGWKAVPKKSASKGRAQHPMARKARALWISLYQLGVVRSSSEASLEKFAKRQLGCERLVWAKQSHGARLIEGLKNMGERAGWKQTDENGRNLGVRALQEGLCKAILARLVEIEFAPPQWTIDDAAFKLCGIETDGETPMTAERYVDLATALGAKLREAGGAVS